MGKSFAIGFVRGVLLFAIFRLLQRVLAFFRLRTRINQRIAGPPSSLLMGNFGDFKEHGEFSREFANFLHNSGDERVRFWLGWKLYISLNSLELAKKYFSEFRESSRSKKCIIKAMAAGEARKRMHGLAASKAAELCAKKDLLEPQDLNWLVWDVLGEFIFGAPWAEPNVPRGKRLFYLRSMPPPNSKAEIQTVLQDMTLNALESKPKRLQRWSLVRNLPTNVISSEELGDAMLDHLIETYDMARSVMYWVLLHLATDKHVQNKLEKEITGNFGTRLMPRLEEIQGLPYLHAAFQESIRLRCLPAFYSRTVENECLVINRCQIPRGSVICVATALLGMESKYFGDDLDACVPERFIGEEQEPTMARAVLADLMSITGHWDESEIMMTMLRSFLCVIIQGFNLAEGSFGSKNAPRHLIPFKLKRKSSPLDNLDQ